MKNYTDIIKNKFLEEFTALSIGDALTAIILAFVLSLFIIFVYRITYGGVSYNKSFANCLIMLAMVTAVVILVISSNVVLSLGMVGALSIVRFRTAIKEPVDTAFAFWAIATGIVCGAGYVTLSVLMTLLVGLLFVALHTVKKGHTRNSYMVVLRCEKDSDAAQQLSAFRNYRLKNKNITDAYTELVAEMELSDQDLIRLERLQGTSGVQEITVMSSVSGSVL